METLMRKNHSQNNNGLLLKQTNVKKRSNEDNKDYGEAIEKALKAQSEATAEALKRAALITADAIGQVVKALDKPERPAKQVPKFEFDVIRDDEGKIIKMVAMPI